MTAKHFAILILGFLIPGLGFAKQTVEIHIDNGYVPYSYVGDGQLKGPYVQILETAFSRLENYEVKLKAVPWARGKALMEAGEGIGLTPAYYHGHDWEYLYPYSIPYVTEKVVVICASKLKEDGQTFTNWPADYSGLTFGNVSGYDGWGGPDFHAMVKNKQVNYAEVPSTTKNLLKLLTRQCHCIFFEKTGFKLEYERLKREIPELQQTRWQGIEIFDEISEDGIYIGYTNRNSNPPPWLNDFRRAVDNELYKMMQSKETRQIIESYEY